ncbi:hypothetical protein [Nocardioides bruguierae]|uniref:Uncharacterized protein n=1 Tax=Nocardioides bruguierae TaxID=2945102 RepID=A0A9X2IEQ8_9ACTN|nr:hypothetical protein [Nocardioides bruguierae]MCM0621081.1 hypothetical protein [Nocardioides bruguierae]
MTGGRLQWERRTARLTFVADAACSYTVAVDEVDLRNWLQVVLLMSWRPSTAGTPHERALLELLARFRGFHARGEDPFTGLRFRSDREPRATRATGARAAAAPDVPGTAWAEQPYDPFEPRRRPDPFAPTAPVGHADAADTTAADDEVGAPQDERRP